MKRSLLCKKDFFLLKLAFVVKIVVTRRVNGGGMQFQKVNFESQNFLCQPYFAFQYILSTFRFFYFCLLRQLLRYKKHLPIAELDVVNYAE